VQIDAVISDPVLRKVVGPNAFAAIPRADQGTALLGPFAMDLLLLHLIEPAAEDAHGAFVILVLAALILALDLEPRRQVPDADGALRLVDVLAARPPGPHALPLDVLLANLDLHF